MSEQNLQESNEQLRKAVETRIANREAGKPRESWYLDPPPGIQKGGSSDFLKILEELKETHLRKSQDYGDRSDPLANIRSGASVVGIEAWRGCVVRIADKMQRIKSFCNEGKLANEGFEDALLDLASYAIIALIMFRESE